MVRTSVYMEMSREGPMINQWLLQVSRDMKRNVNDDDDH